MTAITIDTYKMVNILKSKGFSEEQASGITQAVQQIDLNEVVSKRDLVDGLEKLELRMTIKFGSMLFVAVGFLAAIKFLG
jgi:hypothetical protein